MSVCLTQQYFPHMDPVHGGERKPLTEGAQLFQICWKSTNISNRTRTDKTEQEDGNNLWDNISRKKLF